MSLSLKVASALNVKVMEIPTSVDASELWLRDDLEEVYALLFRFLGFRLPAGDEQRGLARDTEVRHSGARSHRHRAETSAARRRRALRHLSIHFFPASCLFLCYTPITSPSAAEAAQRLRLDEEQEEHGQERLAL